MSFQSFEFHPQVQAGITAAGYTTPTPIQSQSIPSILDGRDVLGLAQTGTGKTAAFVLPILQYLIRRPRRGAPRALIVAPTRELAEQINDTIRVLGKQTGLRSLTVYGGVGANPQIQGLRAGVDIVVACPGRLLDLHSQGFIQLNAIEMLVLDEADRMFDMGFLPAIRRILALLPKQRQTMLFSATMPAEIRGLANEILQRPVTVEINTERPVDTIHHAVYPVDQTRKVELLMDLLRESGEGQVLVFTRTKHRAKRLAQQLEKAGMSATSLQGNLSQNRRQEAMEGFRSGRFQVMVATDIAARGIDVSQITHVINFDLPDTAETYTHRTGRTGRMERLGTALSLITAEDLPMLRTIERLLGQGLERRSLAQYQTPAPASANQTFARPERPANGGRRPARNGQQGAGQNGQAANRSAQAAQPAAASNRQPAATSNRQPAAATTRQPAAAQAPAQPATRSENGPRRPSGQPRRGSQSRQTDGRRGAE